MGKKRGYDMKLYRQAALLSALITTIPATGSWLEVKTVNNVQKSFKGNKTTIETRESEDDITLASGRETEFTVSIPCNLADPHYLAFINASNDQTFIALLFGTEPLGTAGAINDIQAGNWSVLEEDSSEPKKEGVIVNFKCAPAEFYKRTINGTAP